MRLRLKRDLFDGTKLWPAGVNNVPNDLLPPRDAEVWDGTKYESVPVGKGGEVDANALLSIAESTPDEEEEEEEVWPDLSTGRSPRSRKRK